MIDPAHFVVKESPDLANASSKARNFIKAEAAMQKYYASVESGFFQLPLKDVVNIICWTFFLSVLRTGVIHFLYHIIDKLIINKNNLLLFSDYCCFTQRKILSCQGY